MSQKIDQKIEVSRRTFLTGLGVGAATAAAATVLPWRPARAQTANVIGGQAHTYESAASWGQVPASVQLGYTHGVQVDRAGRVYVHNQSKDAVAIFDSEGKWIKSWGPEFAAGAHGIQLVREGRDEFLYLADFARHIVVKTTLDGEVIWTLRYPEAGGLYKSENDYKPTNVAVLPSGDFYVADGYGLGYIHHYNAKAEHVRSWGGNGTEVGKFRVPHGIWYDERPLKTGGAARILVADRENGRVQAFGLDGQALGVVTTDLRRPCHFDVRGDLALVPELHGRLTILDAKDKPVAYLGDNPDVWKVGGWPNLSPATWAPNKLISPHGACWDAQGNIYVSEWIRTGRVTKWRAVA
ncbi:MAG: hypothetical protein JWN98_629 [Abditibacteriota bacterium]|nr:hypothetical protein [Abditibacteriota bacterium]